MSVINQMLKDLDDRRGPACDAQLAALQGLGLVGVRGQWRNGLAFAGSGLAVAFVVAIGYQFINWRLNNNSEMSSAEHILRALPSGAPEVPVRDSIPGIDTATEPQQLPQDTTDPEPPAAPLNAAELQAAQAPPVQINTARKPLTPEHEADRLFSSAQLALAGKQQSRAEQLLRDALEIFPLHSDARTQLSALLLNWQRPDDAEQLLAEGLAGNPGNLELAIPYAQLLAARNAPGPALETLDRAIEQNHTNAEALALRAALLYRLDRYSESITAYRSALQVQPQHALWWTGLAVSLDHDRQPDQAQRAYRRAARLPLEKPVAEYVQQRIRQLSRQPQQD